MVKPIHALGSMFTPSMDQKACLPYPWIRKPVYPIHGLETLFDPSILVPGIPVHFLACFLISFPPNTIDPTSGCLFFILFSLSLEHIPQLYFLFIYFLPFFASLQSFCFKNYHEGKNFNSHEISVFILYIEVNFQIDLYFLSISLTFHISECFKTLLKYCSKLDKPLPYIVLKSSINFFLLKLYLRMTHVNF